MTDIKRPEWRIRTVDDETYTCHQYMALAQMAAAKGHDDGFIKIKLDKRTHKRFFLLNLVMISDRHDGMYYRITSVGLSLLSSLSLPVEDRRRDNICPQCGKNPRRGKQPYCAPCQRKASKRRYRLGLKDRQPGKKCPRCKKRERHITSSGHVIGYCAPCQRRYRREYAREYRQRMKEQGDS